MSRQGAASEDALSQLNRDLVSKQREFEDKQRIAKRDLEERQQALQKELGGKLRDIVTTYAEQSRYAAVMVLDTLNLVYLAPSTDLTDMVIKMYNEKYPLAAKAPAATPPK
jgi:Skp family chaperone for outer membrane proteins